MEAEVGAPHPYAMAVDWDRLDEVGDPQEVLVILECLGGPYLVCTRDRGVQRGEPILVGAGEPYQVTYFDGYRPDDQCGCATVCATVPLVCAAPCP
jgi:hypothetical protein